MPSCSSLCVPRWATPRTESRRTLGPAVGVIARLIGRELMPWQQQVADTILEVDENGRLCYRTVTITVPRQSGKTTLILALELHRALGFAQRLGEPQTVAYTAQTGQAARQKFLDDQVPILTTRMRALGIQSINRGRGDESARFENGSRIIILPTTPDAGHGKTLDLGIKDELFADHDFARDQGLRPAMVTRPNAQVVTASTAGTLDSSALNAEIEVGRKAVADGRSDGIAYFEWSADPADDPGSPDVWARCMPALGYTITEDVIAAEFAATKTVEEFQRAYLNITTLTSERVIPIREWEQVQQPGGGVTGEPTFAVDCNPERSACAIVAVGEGPTVEVVDYQPGVDWLVDRCVGLKEKYRGRIAISKTGPAAAFIDELKRRRVRLVELTTQDEAHAAEQFYDRVMQGDLVVAHNTDLDNAVAGAAKRNTGGDAWTWGRRSSSTDISLLVAASAGVWAFTQRFKPKIVNMADLET